jgi:hypothetical protein
MARAEAEADAAELQERYARELAVAEHDARVPQQAAAELRQALQGQGRWARLRTPRTVSSSQTATATNWFSLSRPRRR